MKELVVILFSLLTALSFAAGKDQAVAVNLLHLKALQTSERGGDELYMSVTVYPSQGQPSTKQIPQRPLHWLNSHLDKINNLNLWKGKLAVGQSVSLMFSLMEQDAPPWNTDDLIGTVRVHIKNDAGKIISNWSMPNRIDSPTEVQTQHGAAKLFELNGEGARYQAYFLLNHKKLKAKPKS